MLSQSFAYPDCSRKCLDKYGVLTGGRPATRDDKGTHGYNNENCKCTCIVRPVLTSDCDNYCNNYYDHAYCFDLTGLGCIAYVCLN